MNYGVSSLAKMMKASEQDVSMLRHDMNTILLCKAENKSLLGVFSAVAADYFHRVNRGAKLEEVVAMVNMTPRQTLGWKTAFEVSNELLLRPSEA